MDDVLTWHRCIDRHKSDGTVRTDFAAVVIPSSSASAPNGRVIVAGGYGTSGNVLRPKEASEELDVATPRGYVWGYLTGFSPCAQLSMVVLNILSADLVLAASGAVGTASTHSPRATAQAFDPEGGNTAWAGTDNMVTARDSFQMVTLQDGRALVAGFPFSPWFPPVERPTEAPPQHHPCGTCQSQCPTSHAATCVLPLHECHGACVIAATRVVETYRDMGLPPTERSMQRILCEQHSAVKFSCMQGAMVTSERPSLRLRFIPQTCSMGPLRLPPGSARTLSTKPEQSSPWS